MSRNNLAIETFPAEELARLARLQYVSDEEVGLFASLQWPRFLLYRCSGNTPY